MFKKSQRAPLLQVSTLWDCSKFSFFSGKKYCPQRVPLQFFFDISHQIGFSKKPKAPSAEITKMGTFGSPPATFASIEKFRLSVKNWVWKSFCTFSLYNFGIVRFFQFLSQHAITEFCFFLRPTFVPCDFPIYFYRNPLTIFTRNETFWEHRWLLRVFGTMRLTGDFFPQF